MEKYLNQHMVFVHGNLIKPLPFMSLSCDSFFFVVVVDKKVIEILSFIQFFHHLYE